jgi:penicillin-binding protein 2
MKLGTAFSDSVVREQKTASHFGKPIPPSWWLGSGRALFFTTLLFIALFSLGWRLFDLTIIHGYQFRSLSDSNRTRELIRHAPRGRLLDRAGRELAGNRPVYRLIRPCPNSDNAPCTEIFDEDGADKLSRKGLTSGTYMEKDYIRYYPSGSPASAVTGYTGEITQKELADPYYTLRGYRAGDRIGRMGAEAVFEERLRGRDGRELVEITAEGAITRTLGLIEEIPGDDVTLALDRSLTEAAAEAFPEGKNGAIVVTRPDTGELLALTTSPTFDANIFSQPLTNHAYIRLFDNPDLPMFNRAIAGLYPPGSLFKIVVAAAGLEEGILTAATRIEDTGEVVIGPFTFANWYFTQYGKTEGSVDIVSALKRSNDVFFYKAGEAIGITKIADWAKRFGIGLPLGIEIPGEAGGLMPDPAWKRRRFDTPGDLDARNDQWYLGDTYHVAIGQGYLLTTPIQANAWTSTIANGGKLCRPTIEKIQAGKANPADCKSLKLSPATVDLVTRGMRRACEPGGTGWPLFNFQVRSKTSQEQNEQNTTPPSLLTRPALDSPAISVPVACKTGTAEYGDPDKRTHAWFTAFAPLPAEAYAKEGLPNTGNSITGEPELAVTVIIEGAGQGSDQAAPVAKKILESWFTR